MESKSYTESPTEKKENSPFPEVFVLTKQFGDNYDQYKDQIKDLYQKLSAFVDGQNLPENLKLTAQQLDPKDLGKFLNILNTELLGEYVHIRKLDSKQLLRIIMNYGSLYGRYIDENFKIRLSDQCFFKDLPPNYEIPARAIVVMEKPDIIAQEFSNLKQIELNKNGIAAVKFTQGIPIILNASEEYKSTTVSASSENVTSKIVYGGYYHPKGSILLREIFKELSPEAQNFFDENETLTIERIQEFFKAFGMIVPTEVVIGGELTRSEDIKQETKKSGESQEKGGKLKLLGLVQTWLLTIGYAGQTKKDTRTFDDKLSQQLRFEANGGDEKYITDATKWINSLNNPETWKVIRVNGWKYTYEYLPPRIVDQFRNISESEVKFKQMSKELEASPNFLISKLSPNISLSNKAPYSLCAYNNNLFAFFPHAIHVIPLPDLQNSFKVPVPWKYVKSTVVLKDFIYASTCEGLMKINPQTLKITPVEVRNRDITMCLILESEGFLYAFLDKVLAINPETGEFETVTSSSSWGTATCGFIKEKCAYIVSGYGNLWSLDLESKAEKKIAGSWGSAQAMFENPKNNDEALIYAKQFYSINIKNGKYEKIEDHKYPELLCATMASETMYVATKPDPQGKLFEKVSLYQVKINGFREPLSVEWDSNNH